MNDTYSRAKLCATIRTGYLVAQPLFRGVDGDTGFTDHTTEVCESCLHGSPLPLAAGFEPDIRLAKW